MNDNVIHPGSPLQNVYGPLTPSQVFERTAALLRENFKLFFGIVAVGIGVLLVVCGVWGGGGIWIGSSSIAGTPAAKALFLVPLMLFCVGLLCIIIQIVQGALFVATQAKLKNVPITVGDACKLAAEKVGRLIGIALLIALRSMCYLFLFELVLAIPMLVITLIPGIFHNAGGAQYSISHFPTSVFGIFFVFLMLAVLALYFFSLLWVFARYALSIPAALAENLSVTEAIRRSIHLTKGSKGRLYAVFSAVFVLYAAFAAMTFPVQLITIHAANAHHGITPGTVGVIGMFLVVLEGALMVIAMTFIGVATALCYYDLRVRKEGFGAVISAPVLEPSPVPLPPVTDGPIEDLPVS